MIATHAVAAAATTLPGGGGRVHTGTQDAARPMMGGRVSVHLRSGAGATAARPTDADRLLDRIAAWSKRLSRFEPASELVRLNASPAGAVPVGPTLTAVLDWARVAEDRTDGLVDVAMLDARLAAEDGRTVDRPVAAGRRWSLRRLPRGAVVERRAGVRFDLDGVAKGWLADRALSATDAPSAVVDADGDIAVRIAPGDAWTLGVADPRPPAGLLAVVHLEGGARGRSAGLATSGTSVHRWPGADGLRHHLIDPATWRPARTDIVQATVLADSARLAEAYAKVAVIAGTDAAFELAERPGVLGILLMTEGGEVRASEGMVRWLA